jgi:hypothetical protein
MSTEHAEHSFSDKEGGTKSEICLKVSDASHASSADTTDVSAPLKTFANIKPPKQVHAGPRALEVWIEHAENLPEFDWHESQHVFVQFKPDKSAPNQRPYGSKTSTSVKQRDEAWDERMLICVDEAKPESIRFQMMQWRRFRDHTIVGEVAINKDEMSMLMTQDIGFDMLVRLPLYRDGKQIFGKTDPCFLCMKLVVVADSTKTLLKYHPEVDINLQLDVEHLLETLSVKKSQLPLWRMAFLGVLSGVWMAISACFAFAVAGEPSRPTLGAHRCQSRYPHTPGMRRWDRSCHCARLSDPAAPGHRPPLPRRHALHRLLRRRILQRQLHVRPALIVSVCPCLLRNAVCETGRTRRRFCAIEAI